MLYRGTESTTFAATTNSRPQIQLAGDLTTSEFCHPETTGCFSAPGPTINAVITELRSGMSPARKKRIASSPQSWCQNAVCRGEMEMNLHCDGELVEGTRPGSRRQSATGSLLQGKYGAAGGVSSEAQGGDEHPGHHQSHSGRWPPGGPRRLSALSIWIRARCRERMRDRPVPEQGSFRYWKSMMKGGGISP